MGWIQLSTGNLCRKHIAEGTDIGKEIDLAIKSGKLISNSLVTRMVVDWFLEQKPLGTVILDGYPRTLAQAERFCELASRDLKEFNIRVVRFLISDEAVIDRLMNRFVCTNKDCQAVYSLAAGTTLAPRKGMFCDNCSSLLERRLDDDLQTIKNRLKTYYEHERELVQFYERSGLPVYEVHVEQPLAGVFDDFSALIEAHVS
jgi:adenylate kinase